MRSSGTGDQTLSPMMLETSNLSVFATIREVIHAFRLAMRMEVAFLSEFVGQNRIFRSVDTDRSPSPIQEGQILSLKHGYCKKVVDGELPELIPDTQRLPAAMAIPETSLLPIGAHISVPVRLSDGSIFGTFCCFSAWPSRSLDERALQLMRTVANLIAIHLEAGIGRVRERSRKRTCIRSMISSGEPRMVYQPVVRLADRAVIGAEALARFHDASERPPTHWFNEATNIGLGADLELNAIKNAINGYLERWTGDTTQHLAVNISAVTVLGDGLLHLLRGRPADKLILEITEHDRIEDYARIGEALAPLRNAGVKLAIDDTGSGYASLQHVLQLHPDFLKLDISLTRGVDNDAGRRAMISSVQDFAEKTGCAVIAEGIETEAQYATLRAIGVKYGQGYLLGRPGPLAA